ncbi:MAG: thioredoxin-dependent thiol peroxidase [Thermodesulfobacteriota bacterium]|nr:MAG: thioredoxin-dependent thiol peroxidase [Thermodesulfobacteriota bacterium]
MVNEKDKAPEFVLKGLDESGAEKAYSLKDFSGKKVVLYFYPKDNTPGCTTEACDFSDNMGRVRSTGAVVLGVSPDSLKSHENFKEKYGLGFPLLSDPERKVAALYGAYGEKKMYGKTSMGIIRSTFIIDGSGVVEKLWKPVKVKGHVDEILEYLKP